MVTPQRALPFGTFRNAASHNDVVCVQEGGGGSGCCGNCLPAWGSRPDCVPALKEGICAKGCHYTFEGFPNCSGSDELTTHVFVTFATAALDSIEKESQPNDALEFDPETYGHCTIPDQSRDFIE